MLTEEAIIHAIRGLAKPRIPNKRLLAPGSLPAEFEVRDFAARLSVRARGGLQRAGLLSARRLQEATVHDLIGIKNFGVRSFVEVLVALERVAPPTSALEPRRPVATDRHLSKALTREARRLARTSWAGKVLYDDPRFASQLEGIVAPGLSLATAAASIAKRHDDPANAMTTAARLRAIRKLGETATRLSLEEELAALASCWKGISGPRAAIIRLGWDGHGGKTLEEIGQMRGVTRERVRQITEKVTGALAERSVWAPALDRAIRLCRALAPNRAEVIAQALVDERISESAFHPAGVITAGEATGRMHILTVVTVRGHEWLFPKGLVDLPTILGRVSRRSISRNGLTSVAEVTATSTAALKRPVSESVARAIVETLPETRWLAEDRQWFWMPSRPRRNRLINNLNKILSVAPRIHVSELREGLGRHHRVAMSPPRAAILGLYRLLGYEVERGSVVVCHQPPKPEDVLARNELTMVRVLHENGPLLPLREFQRLCVMAGVNPNSFMIYLTYSPVIERFAPGVYGVRGAETQPGEAEALVKRRVVRGRVRKDHGWTADGKAWVAYTVSPGLLNSGVCSLPAALSRALGRDHWNLKTVDGSVVGALRCKANSAWGLLPLFRRRGAEVGDTLLITLAGTVAVAHIGGADLVESLGLAETPSNSAS